MIEYSFHQGDSQLHNFAMQAMDDLSIEASFIGIGPSSKDFVIPKLEALPLLLHLNPVQL